LGFQRKTRKRNFIQNRIIDNLPLLIHERCNKIPSDLSLLIRESEYPPLALSLMEECGYDSAFMFKYSERPGTYASKKLVDDVPEEIKVARLNEIIALQNRLSLEANQKCVGKTYEVLVEGVSKRSREQLFGRTEQNKVVVFDRANHKIGDFVQVVITEASSATLKGEPLAV
jgi:tRNA-2-methylthio-N6-dimethylallyladenosine synthase